MTHFNLVKLPLDSTGYFEKTIISYINHETVLKNLYSYAPDLLGLKERIKAGPNDGVDRELLARVLKDQYSRIQLSADSLVLSNIYSIKDSKTFTVTTGHQLNLFSGPLYVLFKLISTINLAEKLKVEFPDHHFVPVYWMATEDHDIEEINHFSLFSKKFSYETDYIGRAGKLNLLGIDEFLKTITSLFGEQNFSKELILLLTDAYSDSINLADATRKWVHSLLGKYGLVVLDADHIDLKRLFSSTIEKELTQKFIYNRANLAIEELKAHYPVQVNPRELNLFYVNDSSRNRIVYEDDAFRVLNTDIIFSKNQILDELNSHPDHFSPNVLMRPLYQETILPNIAYIGGPSEIAYWLELKFVFEEMKLNMPVLLLRNCAMIIDVSSITKWKKFGFDITQLFNPENVLVKEFLANKNLSAFSLSDESQKIAAIFFEVTQKISSIDQSLTSTSESEKQKTLNSLKQLEDKVTRSLKRKEETEINQIKKIKDKFLPDGVLQERKETLIPFYLKYGSGFIDEIKNAFDPLDNRFMIFEEI